MIRYFTIFVIASLTASVAQSACRTFETLIDEVDWLAEEFGTGPSVLHPMLDPSQDDPTTRIGQILLASQELTDADKNSSLRAAALHLLMLETLLEGADEVSEGVLLGMGGHFVEEYGLPDMDAAEIFRCTLLCEDENLNQCVETKGGP